MNSSIDENADGVEYFLNDTSIHYKFNKKAHPAPEFIELKNAYFSKPSLKNIEAGWKQPIGAIYDGNDNLVEQSRLRIHQDLPEKIQRCSSANRYSDKYIYLGYYNEVYGHFILESLARLWATQVRDVSRYKFVFHSMHNNTVFNKKYCLDVLSQFGVNESNTIILNEDAVFENILVPSSLSFIGESQHEDIKKIFQAVYPAKAGVSKTYAKKVYVSRKEVKPGNHCFINEDQIEAVFRMYGFDIVHPEQTSLEEQIMMYRSADVIAGPLSSALHNSVFCNDGVKVIALNGRWNRVRPESSSAKTIQRRSVQDFICLNYDQEVIYLEAQRAFEIEGLPAGRMPYWLDPSYLSRKLAYVLNCDTRTLHTSEGLFSSNSSCYGLKRYLLGSLSQYFQENDLNIDIEQLQHFDTELGKIGDQGSINRETPHDSTMVNFLPNVQSVFDAELEAVRRELDLKWQEVFEIAA